MRTKIKILFLTVLVFLVALVRVTPIHAQSKDADQTARIKAEVARRVASDKSKVKIKLRNGEELRARIDHADDDAFTITEDKTKRQTQLAYADVASVKGRGMSTGMKIAIVVGVAVVVVAVVGVISVKNGDYFRGGITVR